LVPIFCAICVFLEQCSKRVYSIKRFTISLCKCVKIHQQRSVEDGRVHTKEGCQVQKELGVKKIRKLIKVVVLLIKYGDESLKWGW
jgi:hypothetical protein